MGELPVELGDHPFGDHPSGRTSDGEEMKMRIVALLAICTPLRTTPPNTLY